MARRKTVYKRKPRKIRKRKYRKHRGRKYAKSPYPTVKRCILVVVDKSSVNAASSAGQAQELIYTANGLYDTDTQAGTQSAAYFANMMKIYNAYTVEKAVISCQWTSLDDKPVPGQTCVILAPTSSTISGGTQVDLLSNQTIVRSKLKTSSITGYPNIVRDKLVYKHKKMMPMSGYYESFGNATANAVFSWYFHCCRWPADDTKILQALGCLVKIKYYVTFSNPKQSLNPYLI